MQKIGLSADHAGYELKEELKNFLKASDYDVVDLGAFSSKSVDYPDYGKILGESVRDKKVELGVAICGSGIGMSIAANKIKGIRAALCSTEEMAKLSRNHNDANILALGARFISKENAISCLKVFLREKFEAGRHIKRVKKLGWLILYEGVYLNYECCWGEHF